MEKTKTGSLKLEVGSVALGLKWDDVYWEWVACRG